MNIEDIRAIEQESLTNTITIMGKRTSYRFHKDSTVKVSKMIIEEMMQSCSGQGGGYSPCGTLCPDDQYYLYLMDHQEG